MKQKLNAKDFILIGVLTALMWIICMVISTIMSVAGPVTNVFYPSVVAIPNGIVMMLLLAKVPKKGVFTICAAIQAILFLLVGAFWFIPIGLVIGGIICDFLVMSRNEITMKSMMAAYALFSAIFAFSAICPIKFLQSAFVGAMEKNNIAPEYIQGMLSISFTAKAGQKTALVGESGSGKSTLAKLLIHYYDPQKGSISIGGQKLCDMSLEALNSRISYVAQDQYLFNTSLLENIRLGRLNATDEEVVEAAKKAQCMEFLEKLPQGIHSMAGDAGKMLSGGQRQRISLARAILKDAPIVVLDEATAYADPENEEKMEAAIAELVKGKTLVVIAHKLPAIMNADQICVMDHGKLVATGKHQELIQSCPEYQKLWKAAQDSAEWKVHTAKEGK